MDINGKSHATQNGKTKRSHDRVGDKPKDKAPRGASGVAARHASVTYGELSQLLDALHAAGRGDFSARIPVETTDGVMSALAAAFNRVASMNGRWSGRWCGSSASSDARDE